VKKKRITAPIFGWQPVESWQVIRIERVGNESTAWGDQGHLVQEWFDRGELEYETALAEATASAGPPPRGLWQRFRWAILGDPGRPFDLATAEG
jgi:hypothetical protein